MPFDAGDSGGGGCHSEHIITVVAGVPLCSRLTLEGFDYECPHCGAELELGDLLEVQFLDFDLGPDRMLLLCWSDDDAQKQVMLHRSQCAFGPGELSPFQAKLPRGTVSGWLLDSGDEEGNTCSTAWIVVEETPLRVFGFEDVDSSN